MIRPSRTFSSLNTGILLMALVLPGLSGLGCQTGRPDHGQAITQLSAEQEETNQKLEEIYHRVSVIQFMVDNQERTLADLEKKLRQSDITPNQALLSSPAESAFKPRDKKKERALLAPETRTPGPAAVKEETLPSPQTTESAETLYNQGFAALKSRDFDRALPLFDTVITRFPDHPLADNAIYWTGEIHYSRNNYDEAIRIFQNLIKTYPGGGKVPDALLKIGFAYHALNDTANAVTYLKKVVVNYPFTVPGEKAEAMLDRIE